MVVASLIAAVLLGWFLARRDADHPAPMLPMDLFQRPMFALSAATSVCSFSVQGLAMVALPFPKWTDGRAYSLARTLRIRLRYLGQLRAVGDVIADMAPQLQRTGFDAAVLRAGESIAVARRMLDFFPAFYQADAHERRPHFARNGTAKASA